jgi:hypothetical protein
MEYHTELDFNCSIPMPKVKPTKDPCIEENAIKEIMSLALFGAAQKNIEEGKPIFDSVEKVVQLFKDAGLIK